MTHHPSSSIIGILIFGIIAVVVVSTSAQPEGVWLPINKDKTEERPPSVDADDDSSKPNNQLLPGHASENDEGERTNDRPTDSENTALNREPVEEKLPGDVEDKLPPPYGPHLPWPLDQGDLHQDKYPDWMHQEGKDKGGYKQGSHNNEPIIPPSDHNPNQDSNDHNKPDFEPSKPSDDKDKDKNKPKPVILVVVDKKPSTKQPGQSPEEKEKGQPKQSQNVHLPEEKAPDKAHANSGGSGGVSKTVGNKFGDSSNNKSSTPGSANSKKIDEGVKDSDKPISGLKVPYWFKGTANGGSGEKDNKGQHGQNKDGGSVSDNDKDMYNNGDDDTDTVTSSTGIIIPKAAPARQVDHAVVLKTVKLTMVTTVTCVLFIVGLTVVGSTMARRRRRRQYRQCGVGLLKDESELRSNFQLVNHDDRLAYREAATYSF